MPRRAGTSGVFAFPTIGVTLRPGTMKPNFRTCPQCSTRNRLDKEFCVKCGEPLEGIKAGEPGGSSAKRKPGFVVSDADEGQSPIVPLVIVLLTLGVGFAAWRSIAARSPRRSPRRWRGL